MKVILLQDIPKVGRKYEVKEVANGFAANFLFPKKLAEHATEAKERAYAEKQKGLEAERKIQQDLLAKNLESLKNVRIELSAKANEKGHLFKGIHSDEIVKALKDQAHVDLPDGALQLSEPVKEVGETAVPVEVGDVKGSFTLVVSAE